MPASWSTTSSTSRSISGTISTPEWVIPHTYGTETIANGIDSYVIANYSTGNYLTYTLDYSYALSRYYAKVGAYANGSPVDASLVPNYIRSQPFSAYAVELRAYTNVVTSDFVGGFGYNDNRITAFTNQFYQYESGGSTSGNRSGIQFRSAEPNDPSTYVPQQAGAWDDVVFAVPAGSTVSIPPQIGDTGTQWATGGVLGFGGGTSGIDPLIYSRIGSATPDVFSDFYWFIGFFIGKAAATKTYRVRFEYDYVFG